MMLVIFSVENPELNTEQNTGTLGILGLIDSFRFSTDNSNCASAAPLCEKSGGSREADNIVQSCVMIDLDADEQLRP